MRKRVGSLEGKCERASERETEWDEDAAKCIESRSCERIGLITFNIVVLVVGISILVARICVPGRATGIG